MKLPCGVCSVLGVTWWLQGESTTWRWELVVGGQQGSTLYFCSGTSNRTMCWMWWQKLYCVRFGPFEMSHPRAHGGLNHVAPYTVCTCRSSVCYTGLILAPPSGLKKSFCGWIQVFCHVLWMNYIFTSPLCLFLHLLVILVLPIV